ncbi:MAG: cyclic pyranopterin monophosphate synthase MoaC [Desulfovibrionaceae bacterium]
MGGEDHLTHLSPDGAARMVDVSDKPVTVRTAVARGEVALSPETFRRLREGDLPKGEALGTARIAGVLAAKQTHTLIPLCHPLPLSFADVRFEFDEARHRVLVEAEARTTASTGIEMEAIIAVQVAAATIYDMCKAVQKNIRITDVRLVKKTGGRSGDYFAD